MDETATKVKLLQSEREELLVAIERCLNLKRYSESESHKIFLDTRLKHFSARITEIDKELQNLPPTKKASTGIKAIMEWLNT